jgi:hypothetical protein
MRQCPLMTRSGRHVAPGDQVCSGAVRVVGGWSKDSISSAWRQSSVPKPQAITLRQMPRREILPSSSSSPMPIYRLASFNGKNVALYLQLLSSHLSVTGLIVSISINDDARQRQRHGENSFHPPTPEDAAPTYRVRKAFPAHVHLRQREDA